MQRRPPVVRLCGSRSADELAVADGQPALSRPGRDAEFVVEAVIAILLASDSKSMWLIAERSRRLSHLRVSKLQQPAPFGVDHDDRLGVIEHQHAARHGIDNLLQGRAHAVVLCQAAGESGIALGQFRTEAARLRSADRDMKPQAATMRR